MSKNILTEREKEILALIALGYENKEIAKHVFISYHTVKAQLHIILKKLNAVNRTHAVYTALQLRQIPGNLKR